MQSLQNPVSIEPKYLQTKRVKPGELKISEIYAEPFEIYHQISGERTLRNALPELKNIGLGRCNKKFSAVLIILEGDEFGIITTGTLAELVIRREFDYDALLKNICETLYLASGEEDYGSVLWNNFGIVDKDNNLILIQCNPCYYQVRRGGTAMTFICG